jgi:hypothetical protein
MHGPTCVVWASLTPVLISPKALFFSQVVAAVNTVICGGGAAALALSNALDDAHSGSESIGAAQG